MAFIASVFTLLSLFAAASSLPIDDYVSTPDPNFAWFDTGVRVEGMLAGGVAHLLNVTSQKWLNESVAVGPNGALWTHQVAVVIPKVVKVTNVSISIMTGGCNEGGPTGPAPVKSSDEYLELVAALSASTGAVGIVIYQIPNCHYVYASDPSKKGRSEDAMIGWAWREYLEGGIDEWLPRFPMAKAGMACMTAAEQYVKQLSVASIEGWVVSGASKRGWTTWMVGAVVCPSCPKIVGIMPLVPIVPDLSPDVHTQYKSLGGFTFAFRDYKDAGVLDYMDSPRWNQMLNLVDPISLDLAPRLAKLPKLVVVSSDDEFMQMDWTALWFDKMASRDVEGDTRLLIAPNSEHSLATGIPEILEAAVAWFASVAAGETTRPAFSHSVNSTTGELTVIVPASSQQPSKVVLHHGQTLSSKRRDFRWVRLASNETEPCKFPGITIPPVEGGGNCAQPIIWGKAQLSLNGTRAGAQVYSALPPEPKPGHYTGYYIELFFPSSRVSTALQITTPGYVWPDTFPFADCQGKGCNSPLV